MSGVRVFLAIDLPEQVRSELEVLQNSLGIGRRVPTDNLHLTLSFLGKHQEGSVEDAHEALSTIRAASFDLQLVGLGSFGRRSPKVIFADVARCAELFDLERRITRTVRNAGLEFQKRRFRPHVTIARLPKFLQASELAQVRDYLAEHSAFSGSLFTVSSFQLYQSTLEPERARHEPLASYHLASC